MENATEINYLFGPYIKLKSYMFPCYKMTSGQIRLWGESYKYSHGIPCKRQKKKKKSTKNKNKNNNNNNNNKKPNDPHITRESILTQEVRKYSYFYWSEK